MAATMSRSATFPHGATTLGNRRQAGYYQNSVLELDKAS
jgi:hypothetical protein